MMEDITSCKKFFVLSIIFLALLVLVPTISAAQFDNRIDKNIDRIGKAGYKDIEIRNSFGFGKKLWSGTLDENTDTCGSECSATQTITLHERGSLVDDVIFERIYEDGTRVEVDIKSYQIYVNGNPYELGAELKKGIYQVRLEGEKNYDWKVDWIYVTQGATLEEWAIWSGQGNSINYPTDTGLAGSGTTTNPTGVSIITNSVITIERITKTSDVAATTWLIGTSKCGSEMGTGSFTGDVGEVPSIQLEDDTKYYVCVTGGTMNIRFNTGSAPTNNSAFDWLNRVDQGGGEGPYINSIVSINATIIEGVVTLNSPEDNNISASNTIEFNASASITGGDTLVNMSLFHNGTGVWHRNKTEFLTGATNTSILSSTFSDGVYLWGYEACDNTGACGISIENRTFIIDGTVPQVNINLPTPILDFGSIDINETLNWSIVDTNFDSAWFDYNGTNTTLSGAVGNTTFKIEPALYNLTLYTNDTAGNINSSFVEWEYRMFENSQTYEAYTYETATETYSINVTANSSLTAANLIYNGTSYTGTQSGEVWSTTFDIPTDTGYGNKSFYWNFTYAGSQISSSENEQNVSAITFGICNSTNNVPYINFTFKDEETLTAINASSDLAEWSYYLGSGDETKSLLYTNTTENLYYTYCFSPPDKTLHNTLTFQYSASGYPQRIHVRNADLTNATTEKTLYLLSTADGIYSSIQTVNTIGSPESGVVVQIERQFSGLWTLIGQDTTDSSGLVTFWVNPDYDHRLTFTKIGCVGTSQTIRPTQASYTQTLNCGTASEEVYVSQVEGLRYTRGPRSGILYPGMTNFTYTLFSERDNIINASFQILNLTNGVILNSTSSTCTPSGCILSFMYNASNGENIKGRYYVDTGNGNILLEADAYWRLIKTNVSDTGTIKQFWQNFATLFDEWGAEEVDLNNKIEYSKFVFIFMFLAIILALFNKSVGNYDGQYPGAFAIAITIMIWMGSLAGGLTGQGFFYYSGLFGNTNVANFMNNYILAILSSFMAASIVLAVARRTS